MPYQVAVELRRGGTISIGPYDTEIRALVALVEHKGTIAGVDDRT